MPLCARADVGVVLNETLDESVARITGSGHSAVYFSRICAESPVKLRLCREGEHGSVVSNYITLGEDQPFEWNVVPFDVYVYGVEDARNRPLFGSAAVKQALEERYREKYLNGLCEGDFCRTSNKAEWREMVGATLVRSMYVFVLSTTIEQDRAFIAEFNAQPNENHFNGVTRNCADFTQRLVNTFFPRATGADHINDFGMTSPKAIARSFTRYAHRHPETNLRVYHFAQVPGTIKRSTPPRTGTEQLYRSKKLLVPMLFFATHALPVVAGSYLLTGRFNPQRELEHHPAEDLAGNEHAFHLAKPAGGFYHLNDDAAQREARDTILGTSEEWRGYRDQLNTLAEEAVQQEMVPDRNSLTRFFKRLEAQGQPWAEPDGSLWMSVPNAGPGAKIGLSASNVLAADSDARTAYQLLWARNYGTVKSPKHSRETMAEFKHDWALLQRGRDRNLPAGGDRTSAGSAFLSATEGSK